MRKVKVSYKGVIRRNKTVEAKSIEQMLADKIEGEAIELGGKALLYTERKDGVLPLTNIRTDRFDIAMEAIDTVERSRVARRDKPVSEKTKEDSGKGGKPTESTQAQE